MSEQDDDNGEYDDPEFGIELDKIAVPQVGSVPVPEKPGKVRISDKLSETELEIELEEEPQEGLKLKIIVVVATVFLAAAFFFLWHQKIIMSPNESGKGENREKPSSAYHTIGPIITNLSENKRIEISLMAREDTESTEQISVLESIVRDRILMFITSPDTKKMINESDLKKVTSYIDDEITNLLKRDYNDRVILKELKVY